MIPRYRPRSFKIREYSFWCSPNRYNEYDAKYKIYFCNRGTTEHIGFADTVAEAKQRAREFLKYYFL